MRMTEAPSTATAIDLLHKIAARQPVQAARTVDKPLALYGAGNLGRMAKHYFDHLGLLVEMVVDANAQALQNDPFWNAMTLVDPSEVPQKRREQLLLAVCVATAPFSEIKQTLMQQGWRDVVPFYDIAEFYRDRHPLSNGWFAGELTPEDLEPMVQVLALWQDDISRAHHLQFIAWHSLREDWFFEAAPVIQDDRYFIPQVLANLQADEVFVDVGAHHGDVTRRFLEITQNQFREVWLIEPDAQNVRQLCANLADLDENIRQKITLMEYVLGKLPEPQCFFEGLGYASQICELGQKKLRVLTLDQIRIEPTFIKLHLEGWELDALQGGLTTLQRYRPIVATTSYHNRLGLWELPLWLMQQLPDYQFLYRLHSWCGTGAVIYGIPRERSAT